MIEGKQFRSTVERERAAFNAQPRTAAGASPLPPIAFPQFTLPGGGGAGGISSLGSALIQSIQTAWGSLKVAPSREAKHLKEIEKTGKDQLRELKDLNRSKATGAMPVII